MTEADARPIAIRCGGLLDVETGVIDPNCVLHVAVDGRVSAIGRAGDGVPDEAGVDA